MNDCCCATLPRRVVSAAPSLASKSLPQIPVTQRNQYNTRDVIYISPCFLFFKPVAGCVIEHDFMIDKILLALGEKVCQTAITM